MKTYHRWTLLFVGAWLVSVLLTLNYNGPFFDEGIYITAGERTFEGHGLSDGYLNWFAGSLAWPVLAAVGYKFGGLVGARTVALILAAVALLGVGYTARNLFGPAAGLWTVVALGLNGSFVSLARLAVYDVLALACIGVTLGAVSQLATSDNRGWLVLATLSLVGAAFAKYPAVLMVVPICLLLLTIRHKRAVMDIGLLGTATAALGLAFFLPVREQLAGLPSWRLANSPSFGTGPSTIAFTLLFYSVVPLVLGGISWILARRQKALAGVMFLTLLMWPVYHLVTQDPVGANKHVVFGFLVAYPLIGYGLSVIWEKRHFWPVVLGVVG
ncbi:MAG: glycosyltransferase family 39 protein, partial [Anaerolineae bacterium]|nr:glycosyltransferase family 39 protein [Anaerolineae bacterium]